jgi:hypothetical protein
MKDENGKAVSHGAKPFTYLPPGGSTRKGTLSSNNVSGFADISKVHSTSQRVDVPLDDDDDEQAENISPSAVKELNFENDDENTNTSSEFPLVL